MPRPFSRRAVLSVLGAGLAGITGALAPRSCGAFSDGVDCPAPVTLFGPEAASLSAAATDPRFVLANPGDEPVRVEDATWAVYRRMDGWTRVASDGSRGVSVTLRPDDETAWALLVRGTETAVTTTSASTTDTATRSTTRYVGPVSLSPGPHAFAVAGTADGDRFEAAARFDVTR